MEKFEFSKNLVKISKIENDHFLMIFCTFLLNFLSFLKIECILP